jgi:hypothetical protein
MINVHYALNTVFYSVYLLFFNGGFNGPPKTSL